MKKILFVTPYNPFVSPLGAASRSVLYRIGHLTEMSEVHLVTFAGRNDPIHPPPGQAAVKTHLIPYPAPPVGGHSGLARLYKTLTGEIEVLARTHALSAALGRGIQKVSASQSFDLVHIDDVTIAPVMAYCPPDVRKLVFFHNLMTLQYRNIYRSRRHLLKKIFAYLEYLRIKNYERGVLRKMTYAVVLTKSEQERARRLSPRSGIFQIPLEISLDQYVPAPEAIVRDRLTFTGTMSYEPNHEGATFFIKKIFPLIRHDRPQTRFFVVGMNPPPDLRALGNDAIVVTGEVPEIQDHINQAEVVVVPLLSGGGMRYKILEAFALGKAIVSTSVGAEGIEYQDRVNILIADEPAHFARQVCGLLGDPPRRESLGFNARHLAERTYATGIVRDQWLRLYSEILERPLKAGRL
jgi:glycosyltransferase involved in cell wall biosynthesis